LNKYKEQHPPCLGAFSPPVFQFR